jgi:hypothetical protein
MFNEEIDRFHRQLNHSAIVPMGSYRRNSVHYPVICYVNYPLTLTKVQSVYFRYDCRLLESARLDNNHAGNPHLRQH